MMYRVHLSICSHILKRARWSGFQMSKGEDEPVPDTPLRPCRASARGVGLPRHWAQGRSTRAKPGQGPARLWILQAVELQDALSDSRGRVFRQNGRRDLPCYQELRVWHEPLGGREGRADVAPVACQRAAPQARTGCLPTRPGPFAGPTARGSAGRLGETCGR
jgi:hypothetical protein